jgi:hypothetical protein
MPCYSEQSVNGGTLFMCGDLGPRCQDHRCNWVADSLCDYPVGEGKTCDRSLCSGHAYEVAPDTHCCAPHYEQWRKFVDAGGVQRELENVVPYKQAP